MKRIAISIIVIVFLVAAVGAGAYYWYQNSLYVSTDNAQVQADLTTVYAKQTGRITDWKLSSGDKVSADQLLGDEQMAIDSTSSADAVKLSGLDQAKMAEQPAVDKITSPINGVILQTDVVPGEVVAQGQPLAMIADLSNAYITAYIDEQEINDVSKGKDVDISLDSYPGDSFHGKVVEIGNSAGNVLQASSALTAKTTDSPEVQRVPVKISIDDLNGKYIALGMNASVQIHK
ncbi:MULTISPECIES: HlyD family secretion protein [Thermoactinomyces]|jgi:multidrug resistance efflux pump|uniref:Efflux RND transporter periplasmic adaptor subunit n=1 Tax=Thermoactinomyces daqus TaxID=1329516 RepID=A0A7W2AHF6_9BACL|nr:MULTISPECIES: efflux RND transporter periplasmic adaptor subunit [Thermoactinomyces]MBA4541649.1 efflux RND transporter periplasmic adaptor subunit [Thermoactinomyces daqus]MBH8606479.1 efflux RND transporter periplasmic adaptor subunit [Thermoactinomyces sp. CICC 10521]